MELCHAELGYRVWASVQGSIMARSVRTAPGCQHVACHELPPRPAVLQASHQRLNGLPACRIFPPPPPHPTPPHPPPHTQLR